MSPAMLAVSDASKHIVQVLQLLDERSLSLSLAINRLELVYLSGLGMLWQNIGLKRESILVKESRKMISAVKAQLGSESAAAATEFGVLSNIITGADSSLSEVPQNIVKMLQSRSNASSSTKTEASSRRNTISGYTTQKRPSQSQQEAGSRDQTTGGFGRMEPPHTISKHKSFDLSSNTTNAGYYPVDVDTIRSMSTTDVSKMALSASEWECILSDLDQGSLNIFNGIYGGQDCASQPSPFTSFNISGSHPHLSSSSPHVPVVQEPVRHIPHDSSSSEAWSASSGGDPSHAHESMPNYPSGNSNVGGTDHTISIKDYGFQQSLQMVDSVKGIMMPSTEEDFVDLGLFDGWDRSLIT